MPAHRETPHDLSDDPIAASRQLLGSVLHVRGVSLRITEVEAYLGETDPASHAYGGPSRRNQVMFGPAAHLYTYTMHGHTCANIVCSPAGAAGAVLIRAGEILTGADVALERRGAKAHHLLARGPGNLTKALGITMADAATPVFDQESAVRLELTPHPGGEVAAGPRVGVSRAAQEPLRFWIAGDKTVSAYRRAKPASARSSNLRSPTPHLPKRLS